MKKKTLKTIIAVLIIIGIAIIAPHSINKYYTPEPRHQHHHRTVKVQYRPIRRKKSSVHYPKISRGLYQAVLPVENPQLSQNFKVINIIRITKHVMYIKFFIHSKRPGVSLSSNLKDTLMGMDIQETPKKRLKIRRDQYIINNKLNYVLSQYSKRNLKFYLGRRRKYLPNPRTDHWKCNLVILPKHRIRINHQQFKRISKRHLGKYLKPNQLWWLGYPKNARL